MPPSRIEIVKGSILDQSVDVIVNAANKSLLGGGGVDGVIHRAAGPELLEECKMLDGCETGQAIITRGWRLGTKYIIHTVGPLWRGGDAGEAELLVACFQNSLKLALEHNQKSIAFPAISTGAYSYPLWEAADIAISSVCDFLKMNPNMERVVFCMIEKKSFKAFSSALNNAKLPEKLPPQ